MTETHEAIKFVQVGRGYGVTRVPVVTFGNIGRASTLHVIHEDKAICGQAGKVTAKYPEVDPKAVRIAGANVCYRCRAALGHVPMPELTRVDEGGSQ